MLVESDYLGAVTTVVQQHARRSLVVLITDLVDSTASAELLAALGRLTPRYLPFCVIYVTLKLTIKLTLLPKTFQVPMLVLLP